MKIALVHDDLVQWGGAERVLLALSELFPDAPIYTSVFDQENKMLKQNFANKKITTSFLQRIPGWKNLYKVLLPLYPLAFEQLDFSGFDVVISQTTRFAKAIVTKPETLHICYCHTPPRFLWNFSGEKVPQILQPLFNYLRYYDQISSKRVDMWIAGSKNVQERIKKIYGVPSKIIYPFIDLSRFENVTSFKGDYLLVISRLNAYKRVDLAIAAANKLKIPLKIVGTGPKLEELQQVVGSTVEFVGTVDEKLLTMLLAGCKALIIAGEEDFGLTSLEAQALGKPVVAFKKGGALETVVEHETGYFFEEQTVESLIEALQNLDKRGYNQKRCLLQAQQFPKKKFMREFRNFIQSL
ncbi:MAG: glycosyltransferase [Candidatus Daviesbacteria bacterium]